jgi:hypothetical protein
VRSRGAPPASGTVASSLRSLSWRTNTTVAPSGATSGSFARAPFVSARLRPLATSTTRKSLLIPKVRYTSGSSKTSDRPSGVQQTPRPPLRSVTRRSPVPSLRMTCSARNRVSVLLVYAIHAPSGL